MPGNSHLVRTDGQLTITFTCEANDSDSTGTIMRKRLPSRVTSAQLNCGAGLDSASKQLTRNSELETTSDLLDFNRHQPAFEIEKEQLASVRALSRLDSAVP